MSGEKFSDWVYSLKEEGSTALSPRRLADALGLPLQNLAAVAGVHRNTLGVTPASPKLQVAMTNIVRALSAAHALNGDLGKAIFWFCHQPIAEFDHFTPMQLVQRGEVQAVIDYVESMSAGAA